MMMVGRRGLAAGWVLRPHPVTRFE
jgi:hypothetical protein